MMRLGVVVSMGWGLDCEEGGKMVKWWVVWDLGFGAGRFLDGVDILLVSWEGCFLMRFASWRYYRALIGYFGGVHIIRFLVDTDRTEIGSRETTVAQENSSLVYSTAWTMDLGKH